MKRRKSKKEGKPMQPRLARDRAVEIGASKVANPLFSRAHHGQVGNPETIDVAINVRESAVETLYARGALSAPQKAAADRFRQHWETYASENVGAIDYSRDHVDGGTAIEPVSQRRIDARQELKRCRIELGARSYELLSRVCGQGKALTELFASKRQRLTAADMLRDGLTDLAVMWGFITGHSQRKAG